LVLLVPLILFFGCKKKEKEEDAPNPTISFTHTASAGTAPVTVNFTASISNSTNVSWDFGDGQTGTGTSVNHTYTTQGFFEVIASTTSSSGVTASANDHLNVSTFTGINIDHINVSVPDKRTDGSAWDEIPGEEKPDLFCEVYNSSGVKITSNTNYWVGNVVSASCPVYLVNPITDFNGDFTIKIMDYDLGGSNETIASIKFRPGDYFKPTIPFSTVFSKNNGAGSTAAASVTWVN